MIPIVRLTWRQLWRDRRIPLALAVLVALVGVSLVLDGLRSSRTERDRVAADLADQQTFNAQGPRNPHSVAHLSRFAFRPRLQTALLDPGVSDYTGAAVWMEAHKQDPATARAAEDRLELGRASELGIAWVWQVVVPLLVLVLGFDAIGGERERRTLPLLVVGGASLARVIAGKAVALFAVFAGALVVTTIVASLAGSSVTPVPDRPLRVAMWVGGYLAYIAVWIVLVLAVSTRARSSRTALIVLLGTWTLGVLAVPRLAATMADEGAAIPSPAAIREAMERDLEHGFDGHAGSEDRRKALEARVLAQYQVTSLDQLPVSFAGIALDEGERFAAEVFDRHHRALADRYRAQRTLRRSAGLVTPLIALQHLSTAAAGTDVEHQLAFLGAAETSRRTIVGLLNADMTAHAAGKDFEYQAAPSLWQTIPVFTYAAPRLAIRDSAVDLAALGAWLLAALALLGWSVWHANQELSS